MLQSLHHLSSHHSSEGEQVKAAEGASSGKDPCGQLQQHHTTVHRVSHMGNVLTASGWQAPRQQQGHPGISHTGVCFSTISLQGQEEAQGSLVSSLPPRSVLGIWDTVASSRHSTTSTNLTSVRVLLSEQLLLDVALSADRIAGKVRAGDALLHQC